MKTILTFAFLALGVLVTAAVCQDNFRPPSVSSPFAQISAPSSVPGPAAQDVVATEPSIATTFTPYASFYSSNEERRATHKAFQKLKSADDEEAKSEAKTELREALDKEYDASLDAYADHLDQLEKKIVELKDQLRRRRSAKSEMVELKFQMLIHEADGLGWPDRSPSLRSNLFFGPVAPASPSGIPSKPPGGVR